MLKVNYSYGPYNQFNEREQWIRITEGCPHNHPYCYEPQKIKIFGIPKIIRNKVKIMDMNLLCKPEALKIIKELGEKRVNDKVVYYELICGIDFRFLTQEIANALHGARFKKIRIAWDWFYTDQLKIKDAITMLLKAGYRPEKIMIFMICNWKISYEECCEKLDLCKVWNVFDYLIPIGKPIPDIIGIKNGKVYAIEIEYGTPKYDKYTKDSKKWFDEIIWILRKR